MEFVLCFWSNWLNKGQFQHYTEKIVTNIFSRPLRNQYILITNDKTSYEKYKPLTMRTNKVWLISWLRRVARANGTRVSLSERGPNWLNKGHLSPTQKRLCKICPKFAALFNCLYCKDFPKSQTQTFYIAKRAIYKRRICRTYLINVDIHWSKFINNI